LPDACGCYNVSPQELAAPVRQLVQLGVTHFGTCCGGSAAHLAAIADAATKCGERPVNNDHWSNRLTNLTADSRHVYAADTPDRGSFTVDSQNALDTLSEEQFFMRGPLRLQIHDQWREQTLRLYHGIPRIA
jgi:hypothetical protein